MYKDGFFLVSKSPFTDLISSAWKINETVPVYLIEQIKKVKPVERQKVAILGLSFKKDIDDSRNSLSYKAKKVLETEGAEVHLHDPFLKPDVPLEEVLCKADVVMIAMNHTFYRQLDFEVVKQLVKEDAVICDIWNVFGTDKIIFQARDVRKTG